MRISDWSSDVCSSDLPGFKPLYQQVKDLLIGRLIGSYWKPGDLLPSEMQLAEELGVSQGTVRKALDEMTADNLLVRRQGRGTYVAEPDQEQIGRASCRERVCQSV